MKLVLKAELDGVVVPSNISPGSSVQFAADNSDINEDTVDGKQTIHATVLVVYQNGNFGNVATRRTHADHSQRKKSLS